MKDGPVRILLKRFALACFLVDLHGTRLLRRMAGRRPYRLGGQCRLCAQCCESPMIQTGPFIANGRLLRRLFLAWHRRVNGFELLEHDRLRRTFVFRCTHFDPATRRCDSYAHRPGMCRDYPRLLLWEPTPPFLPGCGYRAISPNARRVAELLDAEDLPPETREELKRRLHAKDD
ncbi:MAG: YkgJ family cysteine cluster protein [Candidatus Sumerlaeia bacterium]|nr:YkgJ family cysteine cluster protein [Candidatus Sumerlaeia bacterium]